MPAINLVPKSDFDKTTTGRVINWLLSTFRYLVIFVELIVIIGFVTRFWLDVVHANLNDEITQQAQIVNSFSDFESRFRITQAKLTLASSLVNEPKFSSLITQINQRLPEGLSLTKIESDSTKITISGIALKEQTIAQFVTNLNEVELLQDLKLTQLNSAPDSPYINFILEKNLTVDNVNQTEG